MTEVASLLPADHRLTSVKHYEAGPPEGLELVEPGDTFATTKEEEWVSKKKTEVVNTKQIETRVKRQVVLEDGKVVEDSGPMVTTNTTEDTETQEHHQTELRRLGDDATDAPPALEDGGHDTSALVERSGWVAVANPDGVVREVKERRVVSREETEEVKETEDVQHLGDITDQEFLNAVQSGRSDLRSVLRTSDAGKAVVSTGPRLVHESTRSNKVTDTEDTRELSSVLPDGKIVTETQRTTEHEEVRDDELPDDAPEQDFQKESSQRYLKTRDQEDVDYIADGVNVGHEMRYKTETMEVERRGDGLDEPDLFDSLSARGRRRVNNSRQPHRYRGVENGATQTPQDRKDALTRRPLNFDQEEETRKNETSKWLENHFGSESRSSSSTIEEEEHPQPPKTSFFNVTIKSQPTATEPVQKSYVSTVNNGPSAGPRVYSPVEPERDRNQGSGYYKGITEWSERRQEQHYYSSDRQSPLPYHSPSPYPGEHPRRQSPAPDYHHRQYSPNFRQSPNNDYRQAQSPVHDYRPAQSPPHDYRPAQSPPHDYRHERQSPLPDYRHGPSPNHDYRQERESPMPDYRAKQSPVHEYGVRHSPTPDYAMSRMSPQRDPNISPTPPQRKKAAERSKQHKVVEERSRYHNGYHRTNRVDESRTSRDSRDSREQRLDKIERMERMEEPPPDYSPPSPPPMVDKKYQKTRFAVDPPKAKSGNIIGQSIRKLVGKIRSVSAERKAKQRAKRSPSPSYQKGHVIDSNISHSMERQPVQRYYLGEDPFAESIYGRENKYDGVKPARSSRRGREDERRSQSTLGRFSKSTGRLLNSSDGGDRSSQTLPRHLNRHEPPTRLEKSNKSNSTINVSIINTVSSPRVVANEAPAKPARTYKSNLSRSKSFNVHSDFDSVRPNMYTSNTRLDENPIGLKSPGLISSLNRSPKDVTDDVYTSRFHRNGDSVDVKKTYSETNGHYQNGGSGVFPEKNKKMFMSSLKDRAPELFKTLNDSDEDWKQHSYSTQIKTTSSSRNYGNGDIYEPPTRLRETHVISSPTPTQSILRRGSSSSTDFSETFHTTTRNDDPSRPSVTNTVKTISKKTIPGRDGRSLETIESSETKSVTKSSSRGRMEPASVKFFESERRYNSSTSGSNPVVIEVRNYRK